MAKKILLILIVILISALAYFGYNVIQKKKKNDEVEKRIQNLPQFSFLKLNGKLFKSDELNNENPVIITFFHPDCEHCQYEITEIVKNRDLFQNVNYLFISGASTEDILNFSKEYHLSEIPQSFILHDSDFQFEEIFGKASYPTTLIYNKEHKLIEKIIGEVKITKIQELLQDEY